MQRNQTRNPSQFSKATNQSDVARPTDDLFSHSYVKFAIGGIGESPRNARKDEDNIDINDLVTQEINETTANLPSERTDHPSSPREHPSISSAITFESEFNKNPQKSCQVLVELYDLELHDQNGEWLETARWIKYEEDVEGVDHHWGQPHVAFLSMHSLLQIRKCIKKGIIILNLVVSSFSEICDQITRAMLFDGMDSMNVKQIMRILQMKQIHPTNRHSFRSSMTNFDSFQPSFALNVQSIDNLGYLRTNSLIAARHASQMSNIHLQPTIAEVDETDINQFGGVPQSQRTITKQHSSPNVINPFSVPLLPNKILNAGRRLRPSLVNFMSDTLGATKHRSSEIFQTKDSLSRKLPEGTETAQVFVGTINELPKPYFVMLRLSNAEYFSELADGELPVRFIFLIVGPSLDDVSYHELGRSIATLMADKNFHDIAYESMNRERLINGLDQFLDESILIPPGEIDSKRLISGEEIKKVLRKRKERKKFTDQVQDSRNAIFKVKSISTRKKYRFFNGLIEDITNRFPKYWSDIIDALNFQCLTAIIFMFFASFVPAITFGGLMGKYTNEKFGTIETLFAQCICGLIWGLFSAQPLMIMSSTGPVLIFEASFYALCEYLELDFLTIRLHASLWILLISVITVALDGAALSKFVTRFIEEIFASLISIIFIAESFGFLYKTFVHNPVQNYAYYRNVHENCNAGKMNSSEQSNLLCNAEPNTSLLTSIVFFCTFIFAYGLRKLRQSFYLGRTLRRALSDFGVLIAVVLIAVSIRLFIPNAYLALLDMPSHIGFTNPKIRGHGIIVSYSLNVKKWSHLLISPAAAVLVFILLFVETEITELLLSRKNRGLIKGPGMHWDLLLTGICVVICSILGIPWMCAAAVQSLAHCSSLTVMKKAAPGERLVVDYVIEQRITTIGVSLLIGLIAFAGQYLRLSLASLFGVFLYLGIINLSGLQLVQRLTLFFIPKKYFPVTAYTELVNIWKMHFFTCIQLLCILIVYITKQFRQTTLAFPFVLMLFIFLRQFALPRIFTTKEMKALDGEEDEDYDDDIEDFQEKALIPI